MAINFFRPEFGHIVSVASQAGDIRELEGEFEVYTDLYKDRIWPVITNPAYGSGESLQYLDWEVLDKEGECRIAGQLSSSLDETSLEQNNRSKAEKKEQPVVWLPLKPRKRQTFRSLQKWRGSVISVFNDSFLARLEDLKKDSADEEAEIFLAEVSDEDLELVIPGAVFYWTIGYQVDPSGQRRRSSIIRFRRLPVWTQSDLDSATDRAERALTALGLQEIDEKASLAK